MNFSYLFVFSLILVSTSLGSLAESTRQRTRLDSGWRFIVGNPAQAESNSFDDKSWSPVVLPHDWSITGPFDAKATMGGAGGFLPSGVGWYRRSFDAPKSWQGRKVSVEFEGVYQNADIWVNGQHLYFHPYGYTSFTVDLTSALKFGEDNVLAVRVDNSKQKNSRWYSGSGIYRHVWMTVTNPIHVAPWGVFVTTPKADAQSATVSVQTELTNGEDSPRQGVLQTVILSPVGVPVARIESPFSLGPGETKSIAQETNVTNPTLWSPESPQISKVQTQVQIGKETVDSIETPFGIRTLAWAPDKGLLLNGESIKLNGGCVHADHGVLGAAAFDRAEERKIELLKATGFNSLRTSHHPPSPEFLNICDRLGMLVMVESFDCWASGKNSQDYHVFFKDWWERDLEAMVRRDRSHPSVIIWSIGNETREIFGAEGARIGPILADKVRSLDPTRPVTNGILGWPHKDKPWEHEHAEINWKSQDLVGSNYALHRHVERHDQFPDRILIGTESLAGNPSKMYDLVANNVFVVGDYVWSAQDYLGEAGIGRWFYEGDPTEPLKPSPDPDKPATPVSHGDDRLFPWHGALTGDLDILGNRRPMAHLRNIVWDKGEKIYFAVRQPQDDRKIVVVGWGWYPVLDSWTWPGSEGKPMEVELYSRYDSVKVYLNDKFIGERQTTRSGSFRTTIKVPYEPGTLKAVGIQDGKEMETYQLETAGEVVALRLSPDRTKIRGDQQDLSFIQVEAIDANGRIQPNADSLVTFHVTGPASIAGLGNADLKGTEPYQGNTCHLSHGKALIVLRSSDQPGKVTLEASSPGLPSATVELNVQ